jgi:hypothetical protein
VITEDKLRARIRRQDRWDILEIAILVVVVLALIVPIAIATWLSIDVVDEMGVPDVIERVRLPFISGDSDEPDVRPVPDVPDVPDVSDTPDVRPVVIPQAVSAPPPAPPAPPAPPIPPRLGSPAVAAPAVASVAPSTTSADLFPVVEVKVKGPRGHGNSALFHGQGVKVKGGGGGGSLLAR